MICPDCHKIFEPRTTNRWFDVFCLLREKGTLSAKDLLRVIYLWSQSAMWVDHQQSILPTELRDEIVNIIGTVKAEALDSVAEISARSKV